MHTEEYNNDFLSYQGRISRKNYIINMLILLAIFFGCNFIKLENFEQYIAIHFLYAVLRFMLFMIKFASLMAILSVVYRRIADITQNKQTSYKEVMRKIFILFFVFPVLYDWGIRPFIDFIPLLVYALDVTTVFILYPLAFITILVLCFIKPSNIEK